MLNSRTLSQLCNWSRSSIGTYFDQTGTLQYAAVNTPRFDYDPSIGVRSNLLKYSEQLNQSNGWAATRTSIVPNATLNPNGFLNAAKVIEDGNTSAISHYVSTTKFPIFPGQTWTLSTYAKAAERNFLVLILRDSTGANGFGWQFDLANNAYSTRTLYGVGTQVSASIVDVGNGWKRCIATGTIDDASRLAGADIYLEAQANGFNYVSTPGYGMYIWGAQVEQGNTATDYIPTTTSVGWISTPTLRGILIEESRTNLVNNSANLAAYVGTRAALVANATISPDGTNTAAIITADGTAAQSHYVGTTPNVVAGLPYTASCFVKANSGSQFAITFYPNAFSGVASNTCVFDLANTNVVGFGVNIIGNKIEKVGNGWLRIQASCQAVNTQSSLIGFQLAKNNSTFFDGDNASSVYFWGPQVEQGYFATSYIPTYGANTATRTGDFAQTINPAELINNSLGGRQNLFTYSEDFTKWTVGAGVGVLSNVDISPNDTLTAEKITETDTASRFHWLQQIANVSNSRIYTASVYLKAAERSQARLDFGDAFGNGGGTCQAFFDLTNGTVISTAGMLSAQIYPVKNGYYRCVATAKCTYATRTANSVFGIAPVVAGSTAYAGTPGNGIFVWGAQLEEGAVATPYQQTTSVVGVDSRRKNLLIWTEQFENWSTSRVTIATNTTTDPAGSSAADKLAMDSTDASTHYVAQNFTSTAYQPYTASVYAKAGEISFIKLGFTNGGWAAGACTTFDLANGVVQGSTSAVSNSSITSVGSGWYRCSVTSTADATASGNGTCWIFLSNPNGNASFSPPQTGNGAYLWGAQVEQGNTAAPYIYCRDGYMTATDPMAFSFFIEVVKMVDQTANGGNSGFYLNFMGGYPGNLGGSTQFYSSADNMNGTRWTGYSGGIPVGGPIFGNGKSLLTAMKPARIAAALANNDSALAVHNGSNISFGSNAPGILPHSIQQIWIGSSGGGSMMNGWLRDLKIMPYRASNAELFNYVNAL